MKAIKIDILLRDLTLVVMMANLLNGWLPFRPIILRLILLLICVYVLTLRWNKLIPLEKWMFSLSILNFLYFLVAFAGRGASPNSVANNLCAFLPLSIFVYLGRRGVLTERFISTMTVLLLIAAVGYYVNYERMRVASFGMEDSDDLTINASTVFVFLLPLLFFEKNRLLFFGELAVCVFFILSAVKRGNIVAAAIPIGLLLLYQYQQSKRNLIMLMLLIGVVTVGAYYFRDYIIGNNYFMQRLDDTLEGDSSNRFRIYRESFLLWWNADYLQIFFGQGYRAVTRALRIPAHSDWLELLVDNGLVGVTIYGGVFVQLLKSVRRIRIPVDRLALWAAIAAWFAKSVYSMAYVENYLFLLMITIGYVLTKQSTQLSVGDAKY